MITLPTPKVKGEISLEEAIAKRRSVREFTDRDITQEEISQLLWAAQGITDKTRSFRAAPSAGALYPLEIYLITKDGLFHYSVKEHALEVLGRRDLRTELAEACFNQAMIQQAAADIIICAVFERITAKYAERGMNYVYMEAGHAAQNIQLMAVSLGLASVPVGAFDDKSVKAVLGLDNTDFRKSNRIFEEVSTANATTSYKEYDSTITNALVCNRKPLYIIPVGASA